MSHDIAYGDPPASPPEPETPAPQESNLHAFGRWEIPEDVRVTQWEVFVYERDWE